MSALTTLNELDATEGAAVSNALVNQKDKILTEINNAQNSTDLCKVLDKIGLVAEMWEVLDYSYKTKEMYRRAADRAEYLVEANFLGMTRKSKKSMIEEEALMQIWRAYK